jgi:hypothetical protein
MKILFDVVEGAGAAVLAIVAVLVISLIYGPSNAILDSLLSLWRTCTGKPLPHKH